ncbi:sortilin-like isoform X1 [Octopus vulgaris]|uniref:Sortilin-like isoform X1 n=1 Tax=Octopus vulgaris TaxID=6645 RepID=A0AA36ATC8_OCTVU|nr:sortilin-like isoform X1 [Octopus vulgaris]
MASVLARHFASPYQRFFLLLFVFLVYNHVKAREVIHMEKRDISASKYEHSHSQTRFKRSVDNKCQEQEEKFLQDLKNNKSIHEEFVFRNESNVNIMLTWADDGVILVAMTSPREMKASSNLYRSDTFGGNFKEISSLLENDIIRKLNGLQHHKSNVKKIYVITYSNLFITEDGGKSFTKAPLNFNLDGSLVFNDISENHILTRESEKKQLHLSSDGGRKWKPIASSVNLFFWSTSKHDKSYTVYISQKNDSYTSTYYKGDVYTLKKSSGDYKVWKSLLHEVVSFGIQGNFIYATTLTKDGKERRMQISSDGGITWNEAQLETITHDRFFSILDMSEGLIFMHVDDPGDTGHGTLYTSGQDGIIYSKSLERHFYPSLYEVTDFYKIKSMTGVYFASRIQADSSISTVITFDRGGIWQEIEPPVGVPCADKTKSCHLHVHNVFSKKQHVNVEVPLSTPSAVGLILVHGHVANTLQTTEPDVFVSSDGGYKWHKALDKAHHYQIADSGGLLVAVPSEKFPKYIRFSTDEGHCWHDYKFTNENISFTGLLTEPGSQSMSVSIWGFRQSDSKWKVHIIDFKNVIHQKCQESDYKLWLAHSSRWKNTEENTGCLLGLKTSFYRLRPESWCYNGHNHINKNETKVCPCTRSDYQCDYGYEADMNQNCKRGVPVGRDIDICIRGHEEKIVSEGYRKIPGDKCSCENSKCFKPNTKKIDLGVLCHSRIQLIYLPLSESAANYVVAAIVVVILVLVLAMSIFFIHKLCLLRRHKVVYRYSLLNQPEDEIESQVESALSSQKLTFGDYSDDEELLQ